MALSNLVASGSQSITVDDNLLIEKDKEKGKKQFMKSLINTKLTKANLDNIKKEMNKFINITNLSDDEAKVLFLLLKSMTIINSDNLSDDQNHLENFLKDSKDKYKKKNYINCVYLPNPTNTGFLS